MLILAEWQQLFHAILRRIVLKAHVTDGGEAWSIGSIKAVRTCDWFSRRIAFCGMQSVVPRVAVDLRFDECAALNNATEGAEGCLAIRNL
jgi:hypothetical protein